MSDDVSDIEKRNRDAHLQISRIVIDRSEMLTQEHYLDMIWSSRRKEHSPQKKKQKIEKRYQLTNCSDSESSLKSSKKENNGRRKEPTFNVPKFAVPHDDMKCEYDDGIIHKESVIDINVDIKSEIKPLHVYVPGKEWAQLNAKLEVNYNGKWYHAKIIAISDAELVAQYLKKKGSTSVLELPDEHWRIEKPDTHLQWTNAQLKA